MINVFPVRSTNFQLAKKTIVLIFQRMPYHDKHVPYIRQALAVIDTSSSRSLLLFFYPHRLSSSLYNLYSYFLCLLVCFGEHTYLSNRISLLFSGLCRSACALFQWKVWYAYI